MELDLVFKRHTPFWTGLVGVYIAIKVGPRSDTDLFLDNLVPFEEGCFIKQIFVKSKDCITSLSPFFLCLFYSPQCGPRSSF